MDNAARAATKPKRYRGSKCVSHPTHGKPRVRGPFPRPEKLLLAGKWVLCEPKPVIDSDGNHTGWRWHRV